MLHLKFVLTVSPNTGNCHHVSEMCSLQCYTISINSREGERQSPLSSTLVPGY
jgi:hypothetical protein